MTTSDVDAVAKLERVMLYAMEIMDEKFTAALASIERKIDDAVARAFEGRDAPAAKRLPKATKASAPAGHRRAKAAETSVGTKRKVSPVKAAVTAAVEATTTTTTTSVSSDLEEVGPRSGAADDESKEHEDSAEKRVVGRPASGMKDVPSSVAVPAPAQNVKAQTVKAQTKPAASAASAKKKQKTHQARGLTEGDLTTDEKLLITTGRGRQGEVISTPLGYAYFTKEDDETILSVGKKIGAEPLTLYSMNRWHLKLKNFRIKDTLRVGTRLWIVPHEDWEREYIREDRAEVLSGLHARIKEVFPDFIKTTPPFVGLKVKDFAKLDSSRKFYDDMTATVNAAEAAARRFRDEEKLEDIETIRTRFDEKWESIGFLKPDDILPR